jgi:hypothetical protein
MSEPIRALVTAAGGFVGHHEPLYTGQDRRVTVSQLADGIASIAGLRIARRHSAAVELAHSVLPNRTPQEVQG